VIDEVTLGKTPRQLVAKGMRPCFRVLLHQLGAVVNARDQHGRTAVHWMVITATSEFADEQVQFKPADSRLQDGLETAGVRTGADELREPWLVSQDQEQPAQ